MVGFLRQERVGAGCAVLPRPAQAGFLRVFNSCVSWTAHMMKPLLPQPLLQSPSPQGYFLTSQSICFFEKIFLLH